MDGVTHHMEAGNWTGSSERAASALDGGSISQCCFSFFLTSYSLQVLYTSTMDFDYSHSHFLPPPPSVSPMPSSLLHLILLSSLPVDLLIALIKYPTRRNLRPVLYWFTLLEYSHYDREGRATHTSRGQSPWQGRQGCRHMLQLAPKPPHSQNRTQEVGCRL